MKAACADLGGPQSNIAKEALNHKPTITNCTVAKMPMPGSSVFRRGGQKAELFLNLADDETDYSGQTQAKLRNLLDIWSEPRMG